MNVIVRSILCVALLSACSTHPAAHVMPMRDISSAQQQHDRAECEGRAGHLDVTRPVEGSLSKLLLYTAGGVAGGMLVAP